MASQPVLNSLVPEVKPGNKMLQLLAELLSSKVLPAGAAGTWGEAAWVHLCNLCSWDVQEDDGCLGNCCRKLPFCPPAPALAGCALLWFFMQRLLGWCCWFTGWRDVCTLKARCNAAGTYKKCMHMHAPSSVHKALQ